jgi:lipopolysaccharide/colanic/teichoic acid biosynthesis glycosyltransferase
MIKLLFDYCLGWVGLILLSPLLLAISWFVAVNMGRPVFYIQRRPGIDGRPFRLYKFRTMTNERDHHGRLMPDAQRMTRFGSILRQTSMDELPELFNICNGDMSLVGPRPLLMRYLQRYSSEQARRHEVKPGLTGWAQVNGRNVLSWEEKFKLDVWYVDNGSFWLDMKILLMTIAKVLRREGISEKGEATMSEFIGGEQTERMKAVKC